ncbi:GSCOCG00011754001-RA-CDS, partial [Cotesia congregata]
IQKETIHQSTCGDWYMYRADMITASNFCTICNKRETTSCAGIVKSIRFSPPLNTESILFGKENGKKGKENAIRELEQLIKKKIEPCGLFIDKNLEFLGASPDGLIDSDGIVEIKCLASAKHLTPVEAIEKNPQHRSIFNKNNKNKMNTTHKYYYQVQGQLHITERNYCLFAIWTPLGLKHIKVLKDDTFWNNKMEIKLTRFFYDCLLPEIIDSKLARKMPIRNPDYIL